MVEEGQDLCTYTSRQGPLSQQPQSAPCLHLPPARLQPSHLEIIRGYCYNVASDSTGF